MRRSQARPAMSARGHIQQTADLKREQFSDSLTSKTFLSSAALRSCALPLTQQTLKLPKPQPRTLQIRTVRSLRHFHHGRLRPCSACGSLPCCRRRGLGWLSGTSYPTRHQHPSSLGDQRSPLVCSTSTRTTNAKLADLSLLERTR